MTARENRISKKARIHETYTVLLNFFVCEVDTGNDMIGPPEAILLSGLEKAHYEQLMDKDAFPTSAFVDISKRGPVPARTVLAWYAYDSNKRDERANMPVDVKIEMQRYADHGIGWFPSIELQNAMRKEATRHKIGWLCDAKFVWLENCNAVDTVDYSRLFSWTVVINE